MPLLLGLGSARSRSARRTRPARVASASGDSTSRSIICPTRSRLAPTVDLGEAGSRAAGLMGPPGGKLVRGNEHARLLAVWPAWMHALLGEERRIYAIESCKNAAWGS